MSDPYSEFGGSQSTPAASSGASDPYAEFGGTAQAAQQPAASQPPSGWDAVKQARHFGNAKAIGADAAKAVQLAAMMGAGGMARVGAPQPVAAPEAPAEAPAQPIPAGQLPIAKGNPYAGARTPSNMSVAQSTNIGLHGYEPNSQTMLVQFKNGRVYEYRGVPQQIYEQYQQSESQGSFFANNIKGRYETNFRGTVKPTTGAQIRQVLSGKPDIQSPVVTMNKQ